MTALWLQWVSAGLVVISASGAIVIWVVMARRIRRLSDALSAIELRINDLVCKAVRLPTRSRSIPLSEISGLPPIGAFVEDSEGLTRWAPRYDEIMIRVTAQGGALFVRQGGAVIHVDMTVDDLCLLRARLDDVLAFHDVLRPPVGEAEAPS